MLRKRVGDSLEIINTETGEVRYIKLATEKQITFIRLLEKEAGFEPRQYNGLTIWQAKKVINKLVKRTKQKRLV